MDRPVRGAPYLYDFRESDSAPPWPCDAHAASDTEAWYRGIDIDAPPAHVFRWLCQLRVAPYSYDWIDNFGRQSPLVRSPELEALEVGQTIMSIFGLLDWTPGASLTIATRDAGHRLFGKLVLTYRVTAAEEETRLAVKLRAPCSPELGKRAARYALAWGDWVMMRKQLLTLRARAESDCPVR
jgi:hypothetical protein